jgi:hypothetical protein
MDGTWSTKHGLRRVRNEPPTVDEAVAAASGITDDPQQQVEIAASLIGLPEDQVRSALAKAATQRKRQVGTVGVTARGGVQRAVVVERKGLRRPSSPPRVRKFNV